jgi:membrane protein YqaA with SNARE-associated domain
MFLLISILTVTAIVAWLLRQAHKEVITKAIRSVAIIASCLLTMSPELLCVMLVIHAMRNFVLILAVALVCIGI